MNNGLCLSKTNGTSIYVFVNLLYFLYLKFMCIKESYVFIHLFFNTTNKYNSQCVGLFFFQGETFCLMTNIEQRYWSPVSNSDLSVLPFGIQAVTSCVKVTDIPLASNTSIISLFRMELVSNKEDHERPVKNCFFQMMSCLTFFRLVNDSRYDNFLSRIIFINFEQLVTVILLCNLFSYTDFFFILFQIQEFTMIHCSLYS